MTCALGIIWWIITQIKWWICYFSLTPAPRESHDCVTWRRLVFIPVVPGRPPNPEWPHHISHSRLGNGLRTWRYVWGTTLKHYGCLRIKAQRNSPVLKKSSVQYCPWRPHPSTTTCIDDNVWLLLQVMEVNVTLVLSLWFIFEVLETKLFCESAGYVFWEIMLLY